MHSFTEEQVAKLRQMDATFRLVRKQMNAEWHRIIATSIEGMEGKGLGFTHGKLVIGIAERGPLKASEAAELLGITNGAVTGIADKLIHLGFMERKRSEQDRRIVMLDITERARGLIEEIDNVRDKIMIRLFGNFTDEEMDNAAKVFLKMSENLNRCNC